jgi:hypothetical protein
MTKKTKLLIYLRSLGFDVKYQTDNIICTHGNNIIAMKRGRLYDQIYRGIKYQLSAQGYDVSNFDDDFLTKRKRIIEPFEIQYDIKPQGAVIRVNDANRCLLRICRIPKELVFDKNGNVKDFVDITYPI